MTLAGVCAFLLLGGLVPAQAQAPNVKFFAAQSVVPTGSLSYPYRVAVDASGNVYISDTQAERVLKETLTNGVYTESVVVSTGLATPYGIAVDGSGNVYIVDNGHQRIVEETPSGNSYTQTVVSTTTTLSFPTGLAVDASGRSLHCRHRRRQNPDRAAFGRKLYRNGTHLRQQLCSDHRHRRGFQRQYLCERHR